MGWFWGKRRERRGGMGPGAVFACYADLCGGLVIGEGRSRVWEGEGEDVLFVRFVMVAD